MTPPYRPSQGDPTSRFVLFVAAFLIIVGIGSQASHSSASIKSTVRLRPGSGGINHEVGDCEDAGTIHEAIYRQGDRYPVTGVNAIAIPLPGSYT